MIVVAGEALVDFTPHEVAGVTGYVAHPGGSPYNVAVGLGRLRVPTAFLGRVSSDHFGRLLRSHLANSGVSLELVSTAEEPTTLAFVHVGADEPNYSFYAEGTADRMLRPEHVPGLPASTALLHLGSISLVLEPTASTLEDLLRREARRRVLSLDPNVRPGLIDDPERYRSRFRDWIDLVDIVKVSAADLAWLLPDTTASQAAAVWLEAGVVLVLVTSGADGSLAFTATASASAACPQVDVVDTVGAGDAFTAGALAHLHDNGWLSRERLATLSEAELEGVLAVSNEVAAATCTRAGADPPRR